MTLSPECPECGTNRSDVLQAGYDMMGIRIRQRKCKECKHPFGTAEVVLPEDFVFADTDVFKADRDHKKYESRVGRKVPQVAARRTKDVIVGSVRVSKGTKSNWCKKGLHKLEGDNLYIAKKNGHRICRGCRTITTRAYKERNRKRINAKRMARRLAAKMTRQLQEPIAA